MHGAGHAGQAGFAGLLNAAEAQALLTETQTPGGPSEGSPGAMQRGAAKPKGALNRGEGSAEGVREEVPIQKGLVQEGHFAAEQGASEAAADDDFDQEMKAN